MLRHAHWTSAHPNEPYYDNARVKLEDEHNRKPVKEGPDVKPPKPTAKESAANATAPAAPEADNE